MNYRMILRTQGVILMLEALFMSIAAFVSVYYGESSSIHLFMSTGITFLCGILLWLIIKPKEKTVRAKEGLIVTAIAWIFLSLFGSLPFIFSKTYPSATDAIFETISGFTTTGATISTNLEAIPNGIMLWRCITHWIGGMGILALAVALLPTLSGGLNFVLKAESPGPEFSKIRPKTSSSAKLLYVIYIMLTLSEFVALLIAGMSPFDAVLHALSTAGTGGFNNYSNSVAHFNSATIEAIITVFMILFGVNFSLYYAVLLGNVKSIFRSEELKWYLGFYAAGTLIITFMVTGNYNGQFLQAFRYTSFTVAATMSTTGFVTTNFDLWPLAAKAIIVSFMFIGGCAGSTAGGMKVVRIALMIKQSFHEVRHSVQPRRVNSIRFEKRTVDNGILHSVAVFFFTHIFLVIFGTLLVSLCGQYDFESNLTAVITCICNVGPGLAKLGPAENFAGYHAFAKYVLAFLMLAGRLEIFPMLALFTSASWKKAN